MPPNSTFNTVKWCMWRCARSIRAEKLVPTGWAVEPPGKQPSLRADFPELVACQTPARRGGNGLGASPHLGSDTDPSPKCTETQTQVFLKVC